MSKVVVTGAAGFIGSHLSEALIKKGHTVVGLDAFIPYYPRALKEKNLEGLLKDEAFSFHEIDLRKDALTEHLEGADVVFHLAAMAGLMKSWSDFQLYSSCNAEATQRLLEAAKATGLPQFIFGSTSSVYGKEATASEDARLAPFSPYGITKLASEQLCRAYNANFGVPFTILRYFSVYGPRQRPDMAYNILVRMLQSGEAFPQFGDGSQSRSNTYVLDAVAATMLAYEKRDVALGEAFNVGGGEIVSLNEVIEKLETLSGKKLNRNIMEARPGDQKHTAANIEKIGSMLGYAPSMSVDDGLAAQVAWQRG